MSKEAELKEIYDAAHTAYREAWDAHKRAEQVYFDGGSILTSKAWSDYIRTYKLYNEAGRVESKAYNAWTKERTN